MRVSDDTYLAGLMQTPPLFVRLVRLSIYHFLWYGTAIIGRLRFVNTIPIRNSPPHPAHGIFQARTSLTLRSRKAHENLTI